jgi:DNA replication initiation complex subunit (GINS family)
MNSSPKKDWKELSQAASQEKDPQKLMELVEELNRALAEREAELKQRRSSQFINPKPPQVDSRYLSL